MSLNLANRQKEEVLNILNGIRNPEKINSIDLSGNDLTSLPSMISKFINLFFGFPQFINIYHNSEYGESVKKFKGEMIK